MVRYLPTRRADLRVLMITAIAVITFASLHRYVEAKYILCAFPTAAVLGAAFFIEAGSTFKKSIHPAMVSLLLLPLFIRNNFV